jgi:hypothetical protein
MMNQFSKGFPESRWMKDQRYKFCQGDFKGTNASNIDQKSREDEFPGDASPGRLEIPLL